MLFLCNIIRLGYFKQKQRFFSFDLPEVSDDVNHVMERYFEPIILDKRIIGRAAKLNNQQPTVTDTSIDKKKVIKYYIKIRNTALCWGRACSQYNCCFRRVSI